MVEPTHKTELGEIMRECYWLPYFVRRILCKLGLHSEPVLEYGWLDVKSWEYGGEAIAHCRCCGNEFGRYEFNKAAHRKAVLMATRNGA